MKTNLHLLTCISLFFIVMTSFSQSISRIEVKGKIIVDSPDIEGVTVYNASSNKGTITDAKGEFMLRVALNDRVEVSALQFEKFEVVISEDILEARSMTIFLVERINKLDEIHILPYGLSGNLATDLDNTKTLKPNLDALYFGLANVESFEFRDDYKTDVKNIALQQADYRYNADFVKIALLLKGVFGSSEDKKASKSTYKKPEIRTISSKYSTEYLLKRLNIKKSEIQDFLSFVEQKGFDNSLLNDGKEFEFLDFIITQSLAFKKQKSAKN